LIVKRLLLLSTVIVCTVGLVVSLLFIHRAKEIIKSEIEQRGTILIRAVAKQALSAIQSNYNAIALEGVIKSIQQDPDVNMAMVIDTDGRILAHSDPKKISSKLYISQWEQEVMEASAPKLRFDAQINRYLVGLAITGPRSYQEGKTELSLPTGQSALTLGAIFIGLSPDRIQKRMQETIRFVLASLAGLLIAALILSAIVTTRIVRPLKALTRATFQIAQGNLATQVNVNTKDELGQLAKSFNTMTERLRETTISKKELEAVVTQKTKAVKDAYVTLLETNVQLKRLQETESRFVSMASHELRTPLTSIAGFISLMQKYIDRLSKEQIVNYCKAASEETARLTRMINEVLDLKKIEQGKIELHAAKTDLHALAKSVVEQLRIRPNQPNYRVIFEEEKLYAFVDEDKVKQIFINLLSNSAKYTPPDKTVTIEGFSVLRAVIVNIRDEGPGIPKELWEKLFHPFARANDAVAQKTVGSGLGLAIVKSLVETMGGKVRAENLSTGAQFTVILPKGEIDERADTV